MESRAEINSKKVEYHLTFGEYLEAQRAYIKTSPFTYYAYWVLGVLGIIVGIIGIVMVPAIALGYGVVLLGTYFVLSVTLFHRFRVVRLWKKEPNISKPISVEIAEDELHIISANEDGRIKWAAFNRYVETKNLFLTFRQRNMFNVIPKSIFKDSAELELFRKLLQSKITQKNRA